MDKLDADKPLESRDGDKFNRYPFAKRIADTIKNRKESECLVIGIYGAWGEGKTTVLNFIDAELAADYPNIVVVRFNPWRFKDEETLIKGFYHDLNAAVKGTLEKPKSYFGKLKHEWDRRRGLFKTHEFASKHISDLSKYASGFFSVAEGIGSIANAISSKELEELKSRLEKVIEELGLRLVIVIDDIDRLDKDEVQTIFKIVKLNADFKNTVYVLSFDDKMVSQMMSDKYGGDTASGQNFLEKIVQVPLRLPIAYSSALGEFGIDLINKVLKSIEYILTEQEGREFGDIYVKYFQPRINTPRVALRYSNILNYSLPILKGQVNVVDLMCVEGIKVFYPTHYQFIIQHPNLFLDGYRNAYNNDVAEARIKSIKQQLEDLSIDLLTVEKEAINGLLLKVFPRLREAFENMSYPDSQFTLWYINKRVCSQHYFHRYFTMSLAKGDLSDLEFDQFLKKLESHKNEKEAYRDFTTVIEKSEITNVMTYLRTRTRTFNYNSGRSLCKFLSLQSHNMARRRSFDSFFTNPFDQAMYFINDFMKQFPTAMDRMKLLAEIMQECPSLEFASETLRTVSSRTNDTDEPALSENERIVIFNILKDRILNECNDQPIFVAKPEISMRFLLLWGIIMGRENVSLYLDQFLNNQEFLMKFLKDFIPWWSSDNSTVSNEGDFRKDEFDRLKMVYNMDVFHAKLVDAFGEDALAGNARLWGGGPGQTDANILLQFNHIYRQETPPKT